MSAFLLSPFSVVMVLPMGHRSLSIPSHTCRDLTNDKSVYHSWANNCAAINTTNGAVITPEGSLQTHPRLARASLVDSAAIDFPDAFLPTLTPTNGSTGTIKSYILPGNKTGVVRVHRHRLIPHVIPH
jgi:hypothetical protein